MLANDNVAVAPAAQSIGNRLIRVVIVIDDLEFGGAQRQVVELANHTDPRTCELHICLLHDYAPLAEGLKRKDGFLHVIKRNSKLDLTVIPRLARLLKELQADVVHGYLFAAEIAAAIAGKAAGTPVVAGSERNTDYTFRKRHLLAYALTKYFVHLTIANSNAGAAFNSKMLNRPISNYRVVHNGVDSDRFQPVDSSILRKELGIPEGTPVVGMFASFKKQKNHHLLLKAARKVLDQEPKTTFLFVGDQLFGGAENTADYAQSVHALVDELGIRSNCLFIGNRKDVENYYNLCDLTVLPSFYEGTPNVALESMACGVPVVATEVSDNAHVIPNGKTGFIVPLGNESIMADRILKLLNDPRLRLETGKAAREWILSEFTGKRLAEKTVAIYKEAIMARKGTL